MAADDSLRSAVVASMNLDRTDGARNPNSRRLTGTKPSIFLASVRRVLDRSRGSNRRAGRLPRPSLPPASAPAVPRPGRRPPAAGDEFAVTLAGGPFVGDHGLVDDM